MADIRTAAAGDIAVAAKWVGGVVPTTGDNAILDHDMKFGTDATKTFLCDNLDCLGDGNGTLTVSDTTSMTADIAGLERVDDSGSTEWVVTGDGATTLNEGWTCAGTNTQFTGTVTGGGPAATDAGVWVTGFLTATTIAGTSDTNLGVFNYEGTITGDVTGTSDTASGVFNSVGTITGDVTGTSDSGRGVRNAGTITGDVTGTSDSGRGVINDASTITADNITAQSTSDLAFYDAAGTLTQGAGAAGVNLTVRRLDGGQALLLAATTISDELKVTYVSNGVTPFVV